MNKDILLIRLSAIGDVIHTTPVAASLKAAWPDCRLTWLVGEVAAPLLQENPNVDEVLVWSRERFEQCLRRGAVRQAWQLWQQLKALLAARPYYAVLDVQGLFLTGLIARQAQAEHYIGMTGTREGNSLFMNQTAAPLGAHVTERYLGVLTALGIMPERKPMSVVLPTESRQAAAALLQACGMGVRRLVVLVPGTTWASKNWLPSHFVETARLLAAEFDILICGGPSDVPLAAQIKDAAADIVCDCTGKTDLLAMGALLARADVVVAGDTGPLHMAAALGTATVSIFGPTDPAYFAPQGERHAVLTACQACSFCHKRSCPERHGYCMKLVKPQDVARRVRLLADKA